MAAYRVTPSPILAVVVAQVVEQWHSVHAGQVWIPGGTWLFWSRIDVYLFSLGIGLSLRMCNRTVHTPSSVFSNFLSSFATVNVLIVFYQWTKKRKINPKRGQERPKLNKSPILNLILMDLAEYMYTFILKTCSRDGMQNTFCEWL